MEILEPMAKDPVDFVRQGALIALGMVLVQQSEAASPASVSTRAMYNKIIGDKHEDPMARFGAALGQGLIDAGGRNVTINLQSCAGSRNMNAIIGMALFCQFWYWYPLAHCVALAFEPTAVIGLIEDLKVCFVSVVCGSHIEESREFQVPIFEFTSNAKPSLFAYPQPTKPPTKEAVEKVATAVLSTTAKAKARAKEKKEKGEAMETDAKSPKPSGAAAAGSGDVEMKDEPSTVKAEEEKDKDKATPKRKEKEPSSETLQNLSRVTPAQLAHISFPPEGRFQPVRPIRSGSGKTRAGGGGILMLIDRTPGEPIKYVDLPADLGGEEAPKPVEGMQVDEPAEAPTPTPFEYPFDDS